MPEGLVIKLAQETLKTVLLAAGPVLALSLLVGLTISILQAATQIQEQTLSFVPKLLAVGMAVAIFGPWILRVLVDFCQRVFLSLPGVIY
ncbi:MAG: flagellar biosynthesis protein FliQ [bacterium]|nr:flagellar biosynthesis protein FliQ [bacterium]